MSEHEFVDGLYPYPPRDGAPDFVIGKLSINIAQFRTWMQAYIAANPGEEWVRIDLTKRKNDPTKGSAKIDTWKPDSAAQNTRAVDDDLPF